MTALVAVALLGATCVGRPNVAAASEAPAALGTAADNLTSLDATLVTMGASHVDWNVSYMNQTQDLDVAQLDGESARWVNHHVVTLEIWDTLVDVAAGTHDADLRRIAGQMDTWCRAHPGHELIVRPLHEFNGVYYPWTYGGDNPHHNTPAQLVAAWRHVRQVMRAVAPGLQFIWCPNVLRDGRTSLADAYPGNDDTEYVGDDGYNSSTGDGGYSWRTPTQVHAATIAAVRAVAPPDKPYVIGETGTSEPTPGAARNGHSKAQWFQQLGEWMRTIAPVDNVVAVVYFDHNTTSNDWRIYPVGLSTADASRAAFRRYVAPLAT